MTVGARTRTVSSQEEMAVRRHGVGSSAVTAVSLTSASGHWHSGTQRYQFLRDTKQKLARDQWLRLAHELDALQTAHDSAAQLGNSLCTTATPPDVICPPSSSTPASSLPDLSASPAHGSLSESAKALLRQELLAAASARVLDTLVESTLFQYLEEWVKRKPASETPIISPKVVSVCCVIGGGVCSLSDCLYLLHRSSSDFLPSRQVLLLLCRPLSRVFVQW